jgi:hypothetical protein
VAPVRHDRVDLWRLGFGLAVLAFNPQPEPPGEPITSVVNPQDLNRGGIVAVNPAQERPSRPRVGAQIGG